MRCDQCGLESGWEQLFTKAPGVFGRAPRAFCPDCARDDRAAYRFLAWSTALAAAGGPLLLWLAPSTQFGAWGINLAVLQLLLPACTLLHELGHVLAGRATGFRTFQLEIGHGREAFTARAWGFRWVFRAVPSGGRVLCATRNPDWLRSRWTLLILGGPAMNALLLGLGWMFLDGGSGPGAALAGLGSAFAIAPLLCIVNALLLVYSLWPFPPAHASSRSEPAGSTSENDLRLIWRLWRQPKQAFTPPAVAYAWYEATELRNVGAPDRALACLRAAESLSPAPGDFSLDSLAALAELDLNRPHEARRRFVRLLGRWGRHPATRHALLNNIAWASLMTRDPSLLAEANACSQAAWSSDPGNVHYQGTRGSVLIELGDIEEGATLVAQAMKRQADPHGLAANACYLGLAEARRGQSDASRQMFAFARRLHPACPLLDRAENPTPA